MFRNASNLTVQDFLDYYHATLKEAATINILVQEYCLKSTEEWKEGPQLLLIEYCVAIHKILGLLDTVSFKIRNKEPQKNIKIHDIFMRAINYWINIIEKLKKSLQSAHNIIVDFEQLN